MLAYARDYVTYRLNSSDCLSASDVALKFGLGVLSEWQVGIDSVDSDHTAPVGTHLTPGSVLGPAIRLR
jgi:hypothetical protein